MVGHSSRMGVGKEDSATQTGEAEEGVVCHGLYVVLGLIPMFLPWVLGWRSEGWDRSGKD